MATGKKARDWNEGFGENSWRGPEKTQCADCAYRKIHILKDGSVVDTGHGGQCKAFPEMKPVEVMMTGTGCPKYKPDPREKNL